jgi:ribosomal protein S18 acetylase RimI-like enzyme
MRISMRLAQKTDATELAGLFIKAQKLIWELSPQGFGEALKISSSRKNEEQRFIEELKDKRQVTFVALSEDRDIVGFITGCIEKYSDDLLTAPYLTLAYIYVDEKCRRQGVAQSLIQQLSAWAVKKKIKTMELTVWSNNEKAKNLFINSGYLPLQIRMAKKLKPLKPTFHNRLLQKSK